MRIRYFKDTDTLLIEFKEAPVAETRDLDENTVLDIDAQGKNRTLQGKGFTTRSVWDAGVDAFPQKPSDWLVMEYWVHWLPEEELRKLFVMHGPIQTPRHLLPNLLRAIHAEGWRWAERLYKLYKLRQELEAGHPNMPWVEVHPGMEELLAELVD